MAQLPAPFNAHTVDPIQPAQMLPVSDGNGHPVIITESEFKAAKSGGNNGYLELTCTIIDGPHKGEIGAYRLNLYNDNPQTVDIASRQLSALCHVIGQMMISDSKQLHNLPFRVIVGMQKKKETTDPDYTQITGVLDINGNKPKAGQQPGNAPANPASAPAPAWNAGQQAAPQQAAAPAPWGQPAQQAPVAAPTPAPGAGAPPWAR